MEEATVSTIRPALETLRELDDKRFMDKLAVAIHDATSAVQHLNKPAKISITIKVAPLSKANLTEPVVVMKAKIDTDLPEPDDHLALFYVDEDGNPTTKPQRQRNLNLQIAGRDHQTQQGGM